MNFLIEQAIENEQSYIGSLLKDSTLFDECRISPQQLIKREHVEILKQLNNLNDKGEEVSIISLAHLGGKTINCMGGISYLSDLMNAVPSIHSFKTYEKAILSYWTLEKAKENINSFLDNIDSPFNTEPLEKLIQEINELEVGTVEKSISFKEKLSARYEDHLNIPEDGISGIDTGFDTLNKISDGFQKGDLIVLGARPSMGKTAFMLNNIIKGFSRDNHIKSTFFSIEMAEAQVIDRLIAITGKINLMKLKNPNKFFDKQGKDWDNYTKGIGFLNKLDIDIRKENIVQEMKAVVRKNINEELDKKHIIFIDFLTLMRSTKKTQNRHHEVEDMVLELKRLAVDLKVPVIVLAQLSRSLEQRQDKRPMLSDLRESGAIEQTADMVLFLYRDEYYNPESETKGITEVHIAKNRNGATGKVELRFVKETNSFYE